MADKKLSQASAISSVTSGTTFAVLADEGAGIDNFTATLAQVKTATAQTQGEIVTLLNGSDLSTSTSKAAKGFLESIYKVSTSGAFAVNFNNGSYQEVTLTGNITGLTFTNFPLNTVSGVTVKFIQGGSGSYTIDFTGVYAAGAAAPTISTGVGDVDAIGFIVINDAGVTTADMYPSGLAMGVI